MSELDALRRRAATAEAELESFVYSAAHDLHAPARAVQHLSRMLQMRCSGRLEENDQKLLDMIAAEAAKSQTMIDELLAYSRLGRDGLNIQALDLRQLIAEVVDRQRQAHADRLFEIQLGTFPPGAHGDPQLIKDLLAELLDNAITFTDQSGPVVEVGFDDDQRAYFVRDNGIGVRPADQKRVFTIFQRLHHPGEYGNGRGVGLAKARKIVRLHGGRIWIEPNPGRGTTVFFTLTDKA